MADTGVGAVRWVSADDNFPVDFRGPIEVDFEPFDPTWLDRPIFARFASVAERYADKLAVSDGITQFTYADLKQRSLRLAELISSSARPGAQWRSVCMKSSGFQSLRWRVWPRIGHYCRLIGTIQLTGTPKSCRRPGQPSFLPVGRVTRPN